MRIAVSSRNRAGFFRAFAPKEGKPLVGMNPELSPPELTLLTAEEKQRLLSRLLAQMAHEIRNPLSSLHIHAQLLQEDAQRLDPAAQEKLLPRLDLIQGELHRLENIVKRFLRLSGPSQLNPEPAHLRQVIHHVCELLRPEAAERDIQIHAHFEEPLPVFLADVPQLTQALLNLVINALQAMEKHGQIEVRAQARDGQVILSVADTGPGIPADRLPSIFEPYFTTKTGGHGLGLWIVQQIAMAHHGVIEAANVPSGGAVFTLRLPAKAPN